MTVEIEEALELMRAFAVRTGLDPTRDVPTRYLWTDAFAVCNLIGLGRTTGSNAPLALAGRLVDQVHGTLGYHRADDPREGPISGLPEEDARDHPTIGGLRIGKRFGERPPEEPYHAELEWERDGQYFHYLTKWMHALDRMGWATDEARYHRWARELARTSHRAFSFSAPPGRMFWKMSIDLSRPLVSSMGHHDPLDALVTYRQLGASLAGGGPALSDELRDAASMCEAASWATHDPLGLGGLLFDACRVAALRARGEGDRPPRLLPLLDAARMGLEAFARHGELCRPVRGRLAFRELGLAIGLAGLDIVRDAAGPGEGEPLLRLEPFRSLREEILSCWREPANRSTTLFGEHRDINEVMLATALAPEGFLRLRSG